MKDVGVIVGRFQLPDLHEAHLDLIKTVQNECKKVIVFLGISSVYNLENALDYEARAHMFKQAFPEIITAFIKDIPGNDNLWSQNLDDQINQLTGPHQNVYLYGGRDAFIKRYTGKYPTIELKQKHWVSATEIRAMVKNEVKASSDFRHGVFWSCWQRYTTVYGTVDVAVIKNDELLVARKPHEQLFRLVGGFIDKTDESDEFAATRELSEEVPNIIIKPITRHNYVGSTPIDDPRYKGSRDGIRTKLYMAEYVSGTTEPADDICETKWVKLQDVFENMEKYIIPTHYPLIKLLKEFYNEFK